MSEIAETHSLPAPWTVHSQVRFVARCERYLCDWTGYPWSEQDVAEAEAQEHAAIHNDG